MKQFDFVGLSFLIVSFSCGLAVRYTCVRIKCHKHFSNDVLVVGTLSRVVTNEIAIIIST